MTVISRTQQNYNYPASATVSDTESLHLGSAATSDTESVNNEPQAVRRQQPLFRITQIEDLLHLRKNFGRKKLRRYQNRCSLQTLNEEDETDANDLMESYKSPFARLLANENALQFWNTFVEKTEEEQHHIIAAISDLNTTTLCDSSDKNVEPFAKISSKIRRTIKVRKNLALNIVQTVEKELLDFFTHTPDDICVKYPTTSFDRLLLHAIAQYHGLQSISDLRSEGRKSVKIFTSDKNWVPVECCLHEVIANLRK